MKRQWSTYWWSSIQWKISQCSLRWLIISSISCVLLSIDGFSWRTEYLPTKYSRRLTINKNELFVDFITSVEYVISNEECSHVKVDQNVRNSVVNPRNNSTQKIHWNLNKFNVICAFVGSSSHLAFTWRERVERAGRNETKK